MSTPAARTTRAVAAFDPVPSRRVAAALSVLVAEAVPAASTAVAVPVATGGDRPAPLGLSRAGRIPHAGGHSG
jgi:hypothetical protein